MIKRILISLTIIAITAAFIALIALGLSAISKNETPIAVAFPDIFSQCFLMFGGSSVVSGFLYAAMNMAEDEAFKYGTAFYYGTVFCAAFLSEYLYIMDAEPALAVSAIIVGLLCYIRWIKNKQD